MERFSRRMRNVRAHLLIPAVFLAAVLAAGLTVYHLSAESVQVSSGAAQSPVVLIDRNEDAMAGNQPGAELEYAFSGVTVTEEQLDSAYSADSGTADSELVSWGVINYPSAVMADPTDWTHLVTNLPADTKVQVPAGQEGSSVVEVYYDGMCGYVTADAVTLCESEEAADVIAAEVHSYSDVYGQLLADLPVYSKLDEASAVITTLPADTVVQLISSVNGWYCIHYDNGVDGFVLAHAVYAGVSKPDWKAEEDQKAAAQALSDSIVATAEEYLGCPYVWAASGPSRFDCSGFTMYIMAQYGVSLPHSAASQFSNYGTWVDEEDLIPGDLVYFRSGTLKSASHVGMYIGGGEFIHASSGKGCVTISSLDDSWYAAHYVGAKRMLGN